MGNKNLEEMLNKEYYIIDCENFTYFARIVHVIGIEAYAGNSEISYTIDIPHPYEANEYRTMYMWELERFKTFEEAQAKAKEYNDKPENKKRREDYMSNMQRFLEMKYIVGGEGNVKD